MKILVFGDIIGKTGRKGLAQILPSLKKKYKPDLVIANAENVAHGIGVTMRTVQALFDAGVDFLTTGNHIFDRMTEVDEVFSHYEGRIIRPMNFVGEYPGSGSGQVKVKKKTVYIANFNARVFMEKQFRGMIASPFDALDKFLQTVPKSAIIIVDFHSEATSEKRGFGFHADGRVSLVYGTHTHVQTADAQILSKGTAYISDVGMTGAADSVLGVDQEKAVAGFLGKSFSGDNMVDSDEIESGFLVVEVDEATGLAKKITSERLRVKLS